jgi:bifunctional DNA primase/polymerase-like protein/primase-like protein
MNYRLAFSRPRTPLSSDGIFTRWQPEYADRRIPTFPVGSDKKPQIRRWNRVGLEGSAKLAQRFTGSNALGFQVGPRSGVTVLDIDSQDEAILSAALSEHGDTPLIVRTGGGYHAYYRHSGERRHIRPYPAKPIDILGDGYVVASPSISAKGQYEIIAGTLDDLEDLPPIHAVLDELRQDRSTIAVGERNNTLYRFALQQAIYADDLDSLLDVMRTRNMDCETPLPDSSILSITQSAWRCEQEGRNLVGRGRAVLTPHALIDELIGESQDAFILYTILNRYHWGRDFAVANAMAAQLGWTRKRLAQARTALLRRGLLKLVRLGGFRFPPLFRLVAWGGQN